MYDMSTYIDRSLKCCFDVIKERVIEGSEGDNKKYSCHDNLCSYFQSTYSENHRQCMLMTWGIILTFWCWSFTFSRIYASHWCVSCKIIGKQQEQKPLKFKFLKMQLQWSQKSTSEHFVIPKSKFQSFCLVKADVIYNHTALIIIKFCFGAIPIDKSYAVIEVNNLKYWAASRQGMEATIRRSPKLAHMCLLIWIIYWCFVLFFIFFLSYTAQNFFA